MKIGRFSPELLIVQNVFSKEDKKKNEEEKEKWKSIENKNIKSGRMIKKKLRTRVAKGTQILKERREKRWQ